MLSITALLSALPIAEKTIEEGYEIITTAIKIYDAVKQGLPAAQAAWSKITAVISAGGVVTDAQWTEWLSGIDVTEQAFVQSADKALGIDPSTDPRLTASTAETVAPASGGDAVTLPPGSTA